MKPIHQHYFQKNLSHLHKRVKLADKLIKEGKVNHSLTKLTMIYIPISRLIRASSNLWGKKLEDRVYFDKVSK